MSDDLRQGRGQAAPSLACSILTEAADIIHERANQRDTLQERSMARCVAGFNGLTGHELTEEQGWLFMAVLKMARAQNGRTVCRDDYVDGAAYIALAGEFVHESNVRAETREPKAEE